LFFISISNIIYSMINKTILNNPLLRKEFIEYISSCVFDRRVNQFKKILENRTRYITVVLEDIFQSQNASAVLRTCDCFGIQDIHVVENKNKFSINPDVALGSSKWLDLYTYSNTSNNSLLAVERLRRDGYRIVATTPHNNDVLVEDFDISKGKFALLFGTELTGLSNDLINEADEYIKIPMFGFTESFNISVSVAIILYSLMKRLRESEINISLTDEEKEIVLISWLKATTKSWQTIEKRFLVEHQICNE